MNRNYQIQFELKWDLTSTVSNGTGGVFLCLIQGGDYMSNNLYEKRVLQRVSQYVLAQKTGIPQSRISIIENALVVAKEEEKNRLADALNIATEEIFPRTDSSQN